VNCLDGPEGCRGEVEERLTRSGSGMRFPRCEGHYAAYAEKMDRLRAETEKRYPAMAPADFDPYYANERWDEDDY